MRPADAKRPSRLAKYRWGNSMGQSAVHRNGGPFGPSRRELALQIAQYAAEGPMLTQLRVRAYPKDWPDYWVEVPKPAELQA